MVNNSKLKGTYDLEALEEILDLLLDASTKGALIIVEGRRDEIALRDLGLKGPVLLASRRPALNLAEEVARNFSKVVLLTDWDAKGDELARIIEIHLRSMGSKPDLEIRGKLKRLIKKEIKDVESLSLYMNRMRNRFSY